LPEGEGGVRLPSQVLPPAEMGTAQQEIPVANNTISALNALEVTAVSISNGEWTDSLSWDPPSREELGARVFFEIETCFL